MPNNIIDSIQLSGVTYQIQGSGGGGKAIEAGRGISITTGETADTVSFNLPISAGTGTNTLKLNYSGNTANGEYSVAEGYQTSATTASHAEGYNTGALALGSHAEGYYAKANGLYSHAEGYNAKANGDYSHAENRSTANGQYSHAEGLTETKNHVEHASGQYNNSVSASTTFGDSGNTLFSVGNGTSNSARHNAFEIRQNGDIYLTKDGQDVKLQDQLGGGSVTVDTALDSGSTNPVENRVIYNKIDEVEQVTAAALNELNEAVSGKQDTLSAGTNITIVDNVISAEGGGKAIEAGRGISITTGETADTVSFNLPISAGTGSNSIAEGGNTTASGDYSHAEGYFTQASSYYSHAEGYNTKANGYTSHAEGISTTASGSSSHAEGNNTTANGDQSHAEGYYTTASGNYSHAEGYYTIASGISSHAEGFYTTASGNQSHAEGFNTTASGKYSHAEGDWTIANNQSEHASGQYNVSSSASTTFGDSGNTLFSVGNGTAANARHNAFEIRQNGDIYLSSGGTDIKLQDHLGGGGSVTVDTELDSGSTNPVQNKVIYNKIDEVEQVTAAGLNALNDNFGGLKLVKLSQAQYDALTIKDASTLYIILD